MRISFKPTPNRSLPIPFWIMFGSALAILLVLLAFCLFSEPRQPASVTGVVWLRTGLYVIAIALFPITNVIRHIQLRLDQTMPLPSSITGNEARNRYLLTVTVSMLMAETIGGFGVVMFYYGDSANTWRIFLGMSALAMFLYRPKQTEYWQIITELTKENDE